MRILVIEDDRLLNRTLCFNLTTIGYEVDGAETKEYARKLLKKNIYALVVVDVNLPDGNGFDLCQEIKERDAKSFVIFLTANDMESDMLRGYELGADDYVTKPFSVNVFQKKVSALFNRIENQAGGDQFNDGYLMINFSEMSAFIGNNQIALTSQEFRLLHIFYDNSGIVLTRQRLLEKMWDIDEKYVDEHALTVTISRIRGKIEDNIHQYIKTVYGMGYMWIGGMDK